MSIEALIRNSKWMAVVLAATLAITDAGWSQKNKSATSPGSTPATTPAAAQGAPASTAPMEETMLGYAALDEVMNHVAGFVCDPQAPPNKVLVLDMASLQNLQNFDSFYVNAEALRDAFSALANTPGASSGIDVFADITSAVATAAIASNAETGSTFTISDPSPALILLNKLGAQGKVNNVTNCQIPIYAGIYGEDEVGNFKLPGKFPNPNGDMVEVSINSVQNELSALSKARAGAVDCLWNAAQCGQTTSTLNKEQPNAQPAGGPPANDPPPAQAQATNPAASQIAKPGTTGGKPAAAGAPRNQPPPNHAPVVGLSGASQQKQQNQQNQQAQQVQPPAPLTGGTTPQDPRIAAFNSMDTTYNTFLGSLSTPNATTGEPLLASVLSGFRLRSQLNALSGTAVTAVYVNVAFAGGTQRDMKDLLLNLTTGDRILYSGAVGVNVIVFTLDGQKSAIKFSDFLRLRTPIEQMHNPTTDKGELFNAGDNLGDIPPTTPARTDKKN
jgi:hypothetical protein